MRRGRRDQSRDDAGETSIESKDEEIGALERGDDAAWERGVSNVTDSVLAAGPHGDRTTPPPPPESPSELPPQWLLSAALVANGNEYRDTANDFECYFRKAGGSSTSRVPSPRNAVSSGIHLLASVSDPALTALPHRGLQLKTPHECLQGLAVDSEKLPRPLRAFDTTEEQGTTELSKARETDRRWKSNTGPSDGFRQEQVSRVPGEREWSPIPREVADGAIRQLKPLASGASKAGGRAMPPECRPGGLRAQWLHKRVSTLERNLKEAKAEIALLRETNQGLRTRLNRSETTNLNKQLIIENCKSHNAELTSRQSVLEEQKKVLENEVQALKESATRLKNELKIQRERLTMAEDDKRRQREDLQSLATEMNAKVSTQSEEMRKMRAEMQSLQTRHKERILALEREIQSTVHQCQKRINESHRVIKKYMGCLRAKEKPSPRDAERHCKHQEETAIEVDEAPGQSADCPTD